MNEETNNKSKIAQKASFVKTTAAKEEEILKFWQEREIFKKSLEKESPKGNFVFYDGPPFATGLPHYGHILASTIKDVIPRYKTMQGFHVPRRWGWDCHGLPIENIVEKELGFKHKKDIKEYGLANFNERCRERVLEYAHEWERIIPRMGRFVDMKSAYKTMDKNYMESVWWAFKQLYDKGLVYEDYRSMHICPRCETTLSQQEVAEGYKNVKDISVTVEFRIKGEKNRSLLAWTTTPWTLPGNVALAVGEKVNYVEIKKKNEGVGEDVKFILAKDRLKEIFGEDQYEIVQEMEGKDLVGLEYEPPFDYYIKDKTLKNRENGWKVYVADFVTAEAGTGIAHEAPAFGSDDWELLKKVNLPFVQHVNMDGTFKSEVKDFVGLEVKPKSDDDKVRLGADIAVIKYLQERGTFFSKENITHSYPHCWRCDTPLLNYATSSWFISVVKIKKELLDNAKKINWSPSHVKEGRFGKWLEGARDWSISRQRFWASVLPIWRDKEGKLEVIGSIEELKEKTVKSGNKYFVMRHGESEKNIQGVMNSDLKNVYHLTEIGKKQAEDSAKKLKEESVDLIISSPFHRSLETAEVVRDNLGIKEEVFIDERLWELKTGPLFENKGYEEYRKSFEEPDRRYTEAPEGGETLLEVNKRVGEFLYEIENKYKGKNILIISHQAPIVAMQAISEAKSLKEIINEKEYDDLKANFAEFKKIDFVSLPHNKNYELDLHRPYIDEVELVNKKGESLERVQDVLDTWFDSGSMPYGQAHYPFENKEKFDDQFPAQFIAEGIDMTRAWFYYLHIFGGALFSKNTFQNVIVNGIVLAEDGQKMSKKLKNYPDPMYVVDRYGADALRYYLLSSSVVKAEDLAFSERGLDEVSKKVILKLENVLSFYEMYLGDVKLEKTSSKNVLDLWIISRLNQTGEEITKNLDVYRLDLASRPILDFIDDFSTWYVRRSRDRFKSINLSDKNDALATTAFVLLELSKYMAPFMPFFSESIYLKLKSEGDPESVHLSVWPEVEKIDEEILKDMQEVRNTVSQALEKRMTVNIKVRQPLSKLEIRNPKLENKEEYLDLIKDEVNVKNVVFNEKMEEEVELDTEITVELKKEGNVREFVRAVQDLRKTLNLTPDQKMILSVETEKLGEEFLKSMEAEIKRPTNISEFVFVKNDGLELKIENYKFKISLSYVP